MILLNDLSKKNQKKIKKFLSIINKSVYDYDEETSDLKKELKYNMLIEINELMEAGVSEDFAIKETLNRFGDKKSFSKNLIEIFNKVYFKKILSISLFTSIIASIFLLINCLGNIYIYINNSENSLIYINYFNNDLFRYTFKILLILYAISILLFFIWSLLNVILIKRSINFLFKILPINLTGMLDLFLLLRISVYSINNSILFWISVIFVHFSLVIIPFWIYIIIKKQ